MDELTDDALQRLLAEDTTHTIGVELYMPVRPFIEEIIRLRAALKPFARTAKGVPDNWQGHCGLTFVVSELPSKRTGRKHVYVQSIGGDDVDVTTPTIAEWRAAANAMKGATRDE